MGVNLCLQLEFRVIFMGAWTNSSPSNEPLCLQLQARLALVRSEIVKPQNMKVVNLVLCFLQHFESPHLELRREKYAQNMETCQNCPRIRHDSHFAPKLCSVSSLFDPKFFHPLSGSSRKLLMMWRLPWNTSTNHNKNRLINKNCCSNNHSNESSLLNQLNLNFKKCICQLIC